MTEKSPARDGVTVLEGTEIAFTVPLPPEGPYNGKVIADGSPGLTQSMPPSAEEWTEERAFEDPGDHDIRLVVLGPSDVPVTQIGDLEPADVDENEGAFASWTVHVIQEADVPALAADVASELLENTVGLYTGGTVEYEAVERLKAVVDEVDANDGASNDVDRFSSLPEYEVLAHVASSGPD